MTRHTDAGAWVTHTSVARPARAEPRAAAPPARAAPRAPPSGLSLRSSPSQYSSTRPSRATECHCFSYGAFFRCVSAAIFVQWRPSFLAIGGALVGGINRKHLRAFSRCGPCSNVCFYNAFHYQNCDGRNWTMAAGAGQSSRVQCLLMTSNHGMNDYSKPTSYVLDQLTNN